MNAVVSFADAIVAPEIDHPKPERLVQGNPQRTTWNHFTNATGEVFAGVWSCEVGSWRIEMDAQEDEFFFVTAGRLALTDDQGVRVDVKAGESVVIPAGFRGTFAVLEPVTKHYMIVARK